MTSEPYASPAREAFVHAMARTGLVVEPKEEQEVLRRVARALEPGARDVPDETLRDIVCTVRRKKHISRLVDLTRRSGRIWINRDEIEQAVGTITDPEADDAALERALAPVAEERLRSYAPSPRKVFEAIQADLLDTGRVLSPGQTDLLLMAIAVAFGLPEGDPFLDTARKEEAQRQKTAHTIERTAKEKRQQEEQRLSAWEESLVSFKDVPRILRCSHKEALRWIAENRLPVARK
ncbi:MAG: RNA helicase, partial [Acetobacter orientalis]